MGSFCVFTFSIAFYPVMFLAASLHGAVRQAGDIDDFRIRKVYAKEVAYTQFFAFYMPMLRNHRLLEVWIQFVYGFYEPFPFFGGHLMLASVSFMVIDSELSLGWE